ncbi:MAG: LEA type 2 family protein [Bacteroidetes bacterium]|nr:LEA type 2 family protein [Bacteroidota bacterium]
MLHRIQLPCLLAAVLLAGCMSYSDVEFKGVQGARITRLDASGIAATVMVQVHNPNNYRITVTDPDMDLFLNGQAVGKATLDSAIVLERNSDRTYAIPLHATLAKGQNNLLPVLMGAALTGSVKLGVKGTVVGKAKMMGKRFPFEMEQQLDLGRQ